MIAKLWFLIPEMILFAGVVVISILGLSPHRSWRNAVPWATCAFLLAAAIVAPLLYQPDRIAEAELMMPMLGRFMKPVIYIVGIVLALTCVGLIDRRYEGELKGGRMSFDPMRVYRGEFFMLFLLSISGLSLICNANDLIWLFLALELTSLPTYIMVAISRPSRRAGEAAVKYFFLGALATAIFLYGFALLYGSTGTMVLTEMKSAFAEQAAGGGVNLIGVVGMIITLLGVSFKIAAAPLHFYAADVYEGAASAVAAFLAFVPKAAGMLGIMLLLGTMGWSGHLEGGLPGLPQPIVTALWMIAAVTMTLGNVGALLQRSVKRMLAYSSIAHSGYMLIGVIAGPGLGVNSVLFYLAAYGLMNTAAFAVLAGLERKGAEIESVDDLAGLRLKHPAMAVTMALAAGSLLGVPPLLGFIGKLYLFIAGVDAGHIALVVVAGINSAISAWYYLGLIGLPILSKPSAQAETIVPAPAIWPRVAGMVGAVGVVVVPIFTAGLFAAAEEATSGYDTPLVDIDHDNDPRAPIRAAAD